MDQLDFWKNSTEYKAVKVRHKIIEWLDNGGARDYSDDLEYLSSEMTYRRAVKACGYNWDGSKLCSG